MTTRTFVAWLEPIAAQLAVGRAKLAGFARGQPAEVWDKPTSYEGWTCRDLLAHLAGDTGKGSSAAMRAAVTRQTLDPVPFAAGVDALNARDIEKRRDRSVDELVAEIEADGEEWQELLSQLTETDEELRWAGFPFKLGEYLRILAQHDQDHLADLRTALEASA
ncbi:MAG: DinB family protein [Dehalococcoidia bacterium]